MCRLLDCPIGVDNTDRVMIYGDVAQAFVLQCAIVVRCFTIDDTYRVV